jgi:hypothetical protein
MKRATYRLNYGNGQVLDCKSKAEAFRELNALTQYKAFAFVERYVPLEGDWFKIIA